MNVLNLVRTMLGSSESNVGSSSALNQLNVAFIVDTTGSMGTFINAARQHMIAMLRRLTADAALPIDLHLAVVQYRDHPPQDRSFVTREHAFTRDLAAVQNTIAALVPDGGGDAPEAVYDGIQACCERLQWRPHSRRAAVLIGDAPPHGWCRRGDGPQGACTCGLTADAATALLENRGIILYALGLTAAVDAPFSRLASATGGTYFAAYRGQDAMAVLEALMAREFADLELDRHVLDAWQKNPTATADDLAAALEKPPGRVAASLNRLGRRGLLDVAGAAKQLA
jgi:hypothetical protein